jgi:hypothetical protein
MIAVWVFGLVVCLVLIGLMDWGGWDILRGFFFACLADFVSIEPLVAPFSAVGGHGPTYRMQPSLPR